MSSNLYDTLIPPLCNHFRKKGIEKPPVFISPEAAHQLYSLNAPICICKAVVICPMTDWSSIFPIFSLSLPLSKVSTCSARTIDGLFSPTPFSLGICTCVGRYFFFHTLFLSIKNNFSTITL